MRRTDEGPSGHQAADRKVGGEVRAGEDPAVVADVERLRRNRWEYLG